MSQLKVDKYLPSVIIVLYLIHNITLGIKS